MKVTIPMKLPSLNNFSFIKNGEEYSIEELLKGE